MRFLIIDDSVTMRRIIANILVRLGYPEVSHASNGREALDRLAAETVDVVITDWYMPEMNGLDFVKTLRNSPVTNHIPIVIVTANAASDDIQHALKLGVKSYILKPFSVETMKEKIGALISQLEAASDGESASRGAIPAGDLSPAAIAEAAMAEVTAGEAAEAVMTEPMGEPPAPAPLDVPMAELATAAAAEPGDGAMVEPDLSEVTADEPAFESRVEATASV